MDVGEVLQFQPEKSSLKRKAELEAEDEAGTIYKKRFGGITEDEKEKIIKMVEEGGESESLDDTSVKRMILNFEKRVFKNQELRIKYPDLPEKFMESEIELNDMIQEMHVIATMPDMYQILVDLNAVQSLLQLLGHENTDISIAVVDLLKELTDVETLNENEEGGAALIEALWEDGVFNTLAIMENILEFRPDICSEAAQQNLLTWLLKRLKAKMPFDSNKLYASEILAILLQDTIEVRELVGENDGIDILLQQLAAYKRHDPITSEETELMENLFNCVCSCLLFPLNRDKFLKGEGLQLMNLMLREKKMSRFSSIKVLDHSMTGPEGSDNCQKFIDILGLRSIFPLFMKTPKRNKKGAREEEVEEHIVSIIASLMKNCLSQQRQRLLNKFMENDYEKVDRLVELHFKYLDKVKLVDKSIEKEKQEMAKYGGDVDEELEDEFYLRRLDAGLFTLQLIDYIILEICAASLQGVKQRVLQILNLRGGSVKTIRSIMREYAGNIGDARDEATKEQEQEKILTLLDKF
ncbi:unnamed protein product [Owenia fusiformis]|uniref:Beta-catenin-like protein 1 n=1 Tax=Owenia fusiformis TaxID=6347 RepID=A0A8J1UR64_OWEFU|nr:unnamed protein product [Owenia fusiformis]